jgi:hypothetical protein
LRFCPTGAPDFNAYLGVGSADSVSEPELALNDFVKAHFPCFK